jgi:hypothetical protein
LAIAIILALAVAILVYVVRNLIMEKDEQSIWIKNLVTRYFDAEELSALARRAFKDFVKTANAQSPYCRAVESTLRFLAEYPEGRGAVQAIRNVAEGVIGEHESVGLQITVRNYGGIKISRAGYRFRFVDGAGKIGEPKFAPTGDKFREALAVPPEGTKYVHAIFPSDEVRIGTPGEMGRIVGS